MKRIYKFFAVCVAALIGLVVFDATAQVRPPVARARGERPAMVRGIVTEAATGEALQGVNVVLRDSLGGFTGAATDGDGIYVLSRLKPGAYTLQISFIGFETVRDTFRLV